MGDNCPETLSGTVRTIIHIYISGLEYSLCLVEGHHKIYRLKSDASRMERRHNV